MTSIQHRNLILKIAHGDIYTQEKLNRFGLADSDNCPRCGAIETLKHKILECEYVTRIWREVDKLSVKLNNPIVLNQDRIQRALGANEQTTPASLTLHAEILRIIIGLKAGQNYLIHPKNIAHNAVQSLIIKEKKAEIKELFIEVLNETT